MSLACDLHILTFLLRNSPENSRTFKLVPLSASLGPGYPRWFCSPMPQMPHTSFARPVFWIHEGHWLSRRMHQRQLVPGTFVSSWNPQLGEHPTAGWAQPLSHAFTALYQTFPGAFPLKWEILPTSLRVVNYSLRLPVNLAFYSFPKLWAGY